MKKSCQGILQTGRNEEQPADKKRAQDPSSAEQDKDQGNAPEGQTKQPDQ